MFDFDKVLFRELWEQGKPETFLDYVTYYMSDHLPLWVRFKPKAVAAELSGA